MFVPKAPEFTTCIPYGKVGTDLICMMKAKQTNNNTNRLRCVIYFMNWFDKV